MAPAEVMKTLEQEQNPSLKEMGDKAEKFSDKDKVKLGETIKDRVETFTSMELLKDFSTRPQMKKLENTKNETYTSINEAIKDPTNKEKIIATQKTLGYSPEGKIYYNPSRDDIKDGGTIRTKNPDGKAGAFTIGAMNTAIVDPDGLQIDDMKYPNPELTNLKMDDETSKDGVMKFIGTLHPKFYDAFKNIETSNLSNQEKTIVDTMQKIQKLDASKEDIINMQAALQTLNCYPSNHKKENQDGIPGPFTQVALQNFVFKNNLI